KIRCLKNRRCEPMRQVTGTRHPDTLAFEIRRFCYVLASQNHIRQPYERRSYQLTVGASRDPDYIGVSVAVKKLDFVRPQRCHSDDTAAKHDVLGVDPVFVEDPVVERGVQMNETTRHCAGSHARFYDRFTRLR